MAKILDVNAQSLIDYSKKLDKTRKYDLPDVARRTINSAAFDVKKKYLPVAAKRSFENNRNKGFWKAFSKVAPAKGSKINSMRSVVGMNAALYRRDGDAVENQEMQQLGSGKRASRTFIPMNDSRISKSKSKNVRKKYRLDKVKDTEMIDTSRDLQRAKNAKQRYVTGVIKTYKELGNGGLMKHRSDKTGKVTIFEVRKGSKNSIKTTEGNLMAVPIYSFKEGRRTKPKSKTPYTKLAAQMAGTKINSNFIKFAKTKIYK